MDIYTTLRTALKSAIEEHDLAGQTLSVRCKALAAHEAIGRPKHTDYPIIKGREVMVEADFQGAKGQAFTDEFEQADFPVHELLTMTLDSNRKRATFISGLNAVFRFLDLCGKTVHCKDKEPEECAVHLADIVSPGQKVLLVGHQPRFMEALASHFPTRVVDMDQDNIGRKINNVVIESPEKTAEAVQWCDVILATGSTLTNGTITTFIDQDKPVVFFWCDYCCGIQDLEVEQLLLLRPLEVANSTPIRSPIPRQSTHSNQGVATHRNNW
ncbi:MAG: DUF364 domain-containing protein [Pseudomonadota bacterium]